MKLVFAGSAGVGSHRKTSGLEQTPSPFHTCPIADVPKDKLEGLDAVAFRGNISNSVCTVSVLNPNTGNHRWPCVYRRLYLLHNIFV